MGKRLERLKWKPKWTYHLSYVMFFSDQLKEKPEVIRDVWKFH